MLLVDRVVDLLDEHIDLALRIGVLPDSSMIAARIGSIGWVVCASPAYLAARGVPAHPNELASHEAVTFAGLASANEWPFRIGASTEMFPVRSRFTVTTAEAALDAAIAGAGITRAAQLPGGGGGPGRTARHRAARLRGRAQPRQPRLSGGRLVPLKLRAFLDFAVPRLKERLQTIAAIESRAGWRGA